MVQTLLEHYKILGVGVGAGMADITSSYRKLCRKYHPDVNDDPKAEEFMKKINIAYTALREKLKREAAFAQRVAYPRPAGTSVWRDSRRSGAYARGADPRAEEEASSVIDGYFTALCECEYSAAYDFLSACDKRQISRESFIKWRSSVARLFPMRGFKMEASPARVRVIRIDGNSFVVRDCNVIVTEEDIEKNTTETGKVRKSAIYESGSWKVYLGYNEVEDLTRAFSEKFETEQKKNAAKKYEEYRKGHNTEYDMYSMAGMRNAVSRELYRQKRFGGTLTFAAISVRSGGGGEAGQEALLRSAAGTINAALRKTDIPAYLSDGVFTVLFVELKKKYAGKIITRLIERIRRDAEARLIRRVHADFAFETWSQGSKLADIGTINAVLQKINKKR